jgi:hypothetical protein
MGLLGTYIAYQVGKSRGKRAAGKSAKDTRDPDCINFSIFCENFGGCDGQRCEYDDGSPEEFFDYSDRSDRI